jgi:hypothetical protein
MDIDPKLPIETAKAVKDTLPGTVMQLDSACSAIIEWFSSFVLYPLKLTSVKYKYKLESFSNDLKRKTESIPEEKRHMPDISLVGPTLEALRYSFDVNEIREMYVNLLASSIDKDKDSLVHPSYVDIIKRMNSVDAVVFHYLVQKYKTQYIPAVNPHITIPNTNKFFSGTLPDWYIGPVETLDIFTISASLVRLSKFGILDLLLDRTAGERGSNTLLQSDQLLDVLYQVQKQHPEYPNLQLKAMDSIVTVNEYGYMFSKTVF